jgi:enoyl-CoA hydratase
MGDDVLTEIDGPVGTVTIDRPDQLNALSTEVHDDLQDAIGTFEEENVRVVIVRTTGDDAFVAGADLKEIHGMSDREFQAYQKSGRMTYDAMVDSPAMFVAAVDGLAYGGGFELALAADVIVAEEGAEFALPECKLGLVPGGGGTQRLPRIVGSNVAKELLATGEPIDAERAYQLGLANRLVDDRTADETARDLAETLCEPAPLAVEASKTAVDEGLEASLDTALTLEQELTFTLYNTEDTREGIEAFVEKRDPEFSGR